MSGVSWHILAKILLLGQTVIAFRGPECSNIHRSNIVIFVDLQYRQNLKFEPLVRDFILEALNDSFVVGIDHTHLAISNVVYLPDYITNSSWINESLAPLTYSFSGEDDLRYRLARNKYQDDKEHIEHYFEALHALHCPDAKHRSYVEDVNIILSTGFKRSAAIAKKFNEMLGDMTNFMIIMNERNDITSTLKLYKFALAHKWVLQPPYDELKDASGIMEIICEKMRYCQFVNFTDSSCYKYGQKCRRRHWYQISKHGINCPTDYFTNCKITKCSDPPTTTSTTTAAPLCIIEEDPTAYVWCGALFSLIVLAAIILALYWIEKRITERARTPKRAKRTSLREPYLLEKSKISRSTKGAKVASKLVRQPKFTKSISSKTDSPKTSSKAAKASILKLSSKTPKTPKSKSPGSTKSSAPTISSFKSPKSVAPAKKTKK